MRKLAFLFLFALLAAAHASAQSTIFNAPSTDVQAEKKLMIEADFIAHFDKFERGGFQSYGYRAVYGLRRKFEVGWNFYYTRNGSRSGPKEFQPNFKYKYYQNEKHGIAASAGAQMFVPVNRNSPARTATLFYTNISKVVKPTGGTRLTGGIYTVAGGGAAFGTRRGAIAAIEQPLFGRFSATSDWYSGKNRFGYASAGLLMNVTKRQYFQIGYNFGNSGRANNSFAAFYGITY